MSFKMKSVKCGSVRLILLSVCDNRHVRKQVQILTCATTCNFYLSKHALLTCQSVQFRLAKNCNFAVPENAISTHKHTKFDVAFIGQSVGHCYLIGFQQYASCEAELEIHWKQNYTLTAASLNHPNDSIIIGSIIWQRPINCPLSFW